MLQIHQRAASAQVLANCIHVELHGDEQASAFGHIITSPSPLIALCRALLEDDDELGYLGDYPLIACRGETVCLIAITVAHAAALEVNGQGTRFIRAPKRRRGSPMRQNETALPIPTPTAPDAFGD